MTTSAHPLFTRPGGHSAKNAHRAGAPNHLQGSGETLMVGNTGSVPDRATIDAAHARLDGQTHRFLTAIHRGPAVHVDALAVLVAEISDALTEDLRAERDCLADTAGSLSERVRVLSVEVGELRAQRVALWELLKRGVRTNIALARQNTALHLEWFDLTQDRDALAARLSELDSAGGASR